MTRIVLLVSVLALAGCMADNCAAGCTGSDGNCEVCAAPYTCNSGGTCSATVNGVACCTGSGGGGGGVCAYWSCGGSSQCASVMGAPSGVQCQFAPGQTCQAWCNQYVPGNCNCH